MDAKEALTSKNLRLFHARDKQSAAPALLTCDGFVYHCTVAKGYRWLRGKRIVTLYFTDVDTGKYIGEYWELRRSPYWTITFKNDDDNLRTEFGDK